MQHVDRAEHDTQGGKDGVADTQGASVPAGSKGPHQDEELGDEAIQPGQGHTTQGKEDQEVEKRNRLRAFILFLEKASRSRLGLPSSLAYVIPF